jgi:hypothetical protein
LGIGRLTSGIRGGDADAAYLELALRRGLPLATLDDELIRASKVAGVTVLDEAQWAARAAARGGEGAKIVDRDTGEVIERYPPPQPGDQSRSPD